MRRMAVAGFALYLSLAFAAGALAGGEDVYARCAGCHGADGTKRAMGLAPPLAGQDSLQLLEKLEGYVEGTYGGSKKTIMVNTLKRLTPEQLREVVDYIAGLGG